MIKHLKNYLNTASNGLIDSEVIEYAQSFDSKFLKHPTKTRNDFWENNLPQIRKNIASLINAKENDIALIQNCSWAFNTIVNSIGSGKVLLHKKDYPLVSLPFNINNFECVHHDFIDNKIYDLNLLETYLQNNSIEYYALSHVDYMSGIRYPVEEIGKLCKRYNVRLLVDGTQAFGAFEVDAQNIDCYLASTYKWLGAGLGNGFLYIEPNFFNEIDWKVAGFGNSVLDDQGNLKSLQKSVQQFEPGHLDYNSFARMQKALELYTRNRKEIKEHIVLRTKSFILENELLNYLNLDETHLSGIVSVPESAYLDNFIDTNNYEVTSRLKQHRFSFHYYTPLRDIPIFQK